MQYAIMNKREARSATYESAAPITAIISITDINDELNEFYPQVWLRDILRLQFNDVYEGKKGCMTRQQAKEAADFALRMYGQVERFIVHCKYGQSRSAGVAAAICKYFEGSTDAIFKKKAYATQEEIASLIGGMSENVFGGRAYYPNRTCYEYVLQELRKSGQRGG